MAANQKNDLAKAALVSLASADSGELGRRVTSKHTVTVTRPGYLPRVANLTLVPGEPLKLVARVYTEANCPLPFWLPVAVTGLDVTTVGTAFIRGPNSAVFPLQELRSA